MNSNWLKEFFRSWQQQTTMQIATLSVLIGTFVVISIFVLVQRNLNHILSIWGDSVQMSIFLHDDLSDKDIEKIKEILNKIKEFKEVRFVSKELAAQQLFQQMGSRLPDFLNDPDFGNPLPSSFEAQLITEIPLSSRLSTMVKLAEQIRQIKGIEDVYYGQGWVENYSSLVNVFTITSWILVTVLLLGSLFVIGNSIQNAVFQRRDEIEVMELVGATSQMIRSPYIIEGTIMGIIAASFAILFTFIFFSLQTSLMKNDLHFINFSKYLGFLNWKEILLICSLGGIFGGSGAFFCVRKMASGWSAANNQE